MNGVRQDLWTSLGLLVLRFGAGGFLASHGLGKVQMVFEGKFAEFGDPIGIGATPSLILVAFAEFVCALLVAAGLFTRLAAIPPMFAMGIAAFVAHGGDPWTLGGAFELFSQGVTKFPVSKEPALMFLTAFTAVFLAGAGRFSVDGLLGAHADRVKSTPRPPAPPA